MENIDKLKKICQLIRYDILTSTTKASAGHPTSCLSAVELITTLVFANPPAGGFFDPKLDKLIFSKGHGAPLLYSIYHAAGLISYDEILTLRTFNSRLEGHPTPRFPYVEVATGSLGQGLSMGLGMALGIKLKSLKLGMEAGYENRDKKTEEENLSSTFQSLNSLPNHSSISKVYVLLGDSEMAEGQVWEAMEIASYYKLNNLVAILDVNRLGQQGETMLGWSIETYARRAESFGWNTIVLEDGHDLEKIINIYKKTIENRKSKVDIEDRKLSMEKILSSNINPQNLPSTLYNLPSSVKPTIIIAKTIKGKGISFLENQKGWHGKTLNKEQLDEALKELGEVDLNIKEKIQNSEFRVQNENLKLQNLNSKLILNSEFLTLDSYSTREAYGDALVSLGEIDNRVVVLDAETSNSTYAEKFAKKFPDRFFEMFIAEQNMVSAALGLSKQGFIPFVSTFSAFLTRSFDQIRMSQYSYTETVDDRLSKVDMDDRKLRIEKNQSSNINLQTPSSSFHHLPSNLKFCGSHCGVSIGSDGPSQMGLEDIAMFRSILDSIIFYPSDAVSCFKLTQIMAQNQGIFYLRTTRSKLPVIYKPEEEFKIGGSKILKTSKKSKVLVIAAGITVHEALKAADQLAKEGIEITLLDLYSIKPLDSATVKQLIEVNNNVIVVEDHYLAGGIGETVIAEIAKIYDLKSKINFVHLCVKKLPRSGTMEELLAYEEIDSQAIIKAVKNLLT